MSENFDELFRWFVRSVSVGPYSIDQLNRAEQLVSEVSAEWDAMAAKAGQPGKSCPWYASRRGGQWRYFNTHYRDSISDAILLGPYESLDEAIAAAKASDDNCGVVRPPCTVCDRLRAMIAEDRNRYLCERCGGTGQQPAGLFENGVRGASKAGTCTRCDGLGWLGQMTTGPIPDPRPVLTPETVDAIDPEVCRAVNRAWDHDTLDRSEKDRQVAWGRHTLRVVAKHCRVLMPADDPRPCAFCGAPMVATQWQCKPCHAKGRCYSEGKVFVPDPRPIISDASQATSEQCKGALKAWASWSVPRKVVVSEVDRGRTIIDAALSSVRLDASQKPVLTNAEVDQLRTFAAEEADERHGITKGRTWAVDEIPWDVIEKVIAEHGQVQPAASPATPAPIDTTEADRIIGEIERSVSQGRLVEMSALEKLATLRGRLVLPKPRRLTNGKAWALSVFAAKRHADVPTTENGHAIAAEVARMWGLEVPKEEPKQPTPAITDDAKNKSTAWKIIAALSDKWPNMEMEGWDDGEAEAIIERILADRMPANPSPAITAEEEIAFARVFWSSESWLDISEKVDPTVRRWRANLATARAVVERLKGMGTPKEEPATASPPACLAQPNHEPYTGPSDPVEAASRLLRAIEWPEPVEPWDMIPVAERIIAAVRGSKPAPAPADATLDQPVWAVRCTDCGGIMLIREDDVIGMDGKHVDGMLSACKNGTIDKTTIKYALDEWGCDCE